MTRSEKMVLRKTAEMEKWLTEATAIYNQALYYLRQEFFQAEKEKRKPDYSKLDLYKLVKETDAWKNASMDTNVKQATILKVGKNWKAFYRACKAYWKDKTKFTGKPKLPRYLKNGRAALLQFDKTRLRHKDLEKNTFVLPKSKYKIQLPAHVKIPAIRCVIAKNYYGKIKLCISYEKETHSDTTLDPSRWLGVDLGVSNVVTMTTDNQT